MTRYRVKLGVTLRGLVEHVQGAVFEGTLDELPVDIRAAVEKNKPYLEILELDDNGLPTAPAKPVDVSELEETINVLQVENEALKESITVSEEENEALKQELSALKEIKANEKPVTAPPAASESTETESEGETTPKDIKPPTSRKRASKSKSKPTLKPKE